MGDFFFFLGKHVVKQSARLDPGTEVSVYLFVKNKRRSCTAV